MASDSHNSCQIVLGIVRYETDRRDFIAQSPDGTGLVQLMSDRTHLTAPCNINTMISKFTVPFGALQPRS